MSVSLRPWLHTITLDLGSEQTTVSVPALGFLQAYPSYVSRRMPSRDVVAVGASARGSYETSNDVIEVTAPIHQGAIAHIEDSAVLIEWILGQVRQHFHIHSWLFHPNIVFVCGNSLTTVERKLLLRLGRMLTLRPASILLSGVAVRMASEFQLHTVLRHILMIDCGASQTELSIVGPHGVVLSRRLSWGGQDITASIQRYIRQSYQLIVGHDSAARVKQTLVHLQPKLPAKKTQPAAHSAVVRGRHAITGLPETVVLKQDAFAPSLHHEYEQLLEAIRELLEEVNADVAADVIGQGVYLVGGGSQMNGLQQYIAEFLGTQVYSARRPSEVVTDGAMKVLGGKQ